MWRGVVLAYLVVALCYFPVALIGYYIFGDKVEDNILISLEKPKWLIIAANMFVVVHVIGSYQVMPFSSFSNIRSDSSIFTVLSSVCSEVLIECSIRSMLF